MLGNPHDVGGFAFLAHILAAKLGVGVGYLTVSISNAHVYDIHFDQAREIIARKPGHKAIKLELKANSFDRAENGDADLVQEVFTQLKEQYDPQESLGRMKIVL